MARILSVSYDSTLLDTRQRLFESRGHTVTSACGLREALKHCMGGNGFELLIVGHSIPYREKEALIEHFRARRPGALVIALAKDGEERVTGADVSVEPAPAELLNAVRRLTGEGTAA